ncbi:MAG: GTP-binding protein [Planctomycetota bacterium]|nr:GTP-binding protein [Planctomycetota bacterium]
MWQPGKRIPTNLITGFLGAGKTTAIRTLLDQRPAGERWSIFVNEYGMVSIDHALLESEADEVQVQELGGGCFCCTMAYAMEPLLAQFIRQTKPDRLLIEPSGAGHPARVIDTLRSDKWRTSIDLRATICLVDPKDFDNPRCTNITVFHDQIQMADVVVLNWLDVRDPKLVQRCRQWIEQLDPPKLLIAETSLGQLRPEWLDLESTVVRTPQFATEPIESTRTTDVQLQHALPIQVKPDSHETRRVIALNQPPSPGKPLRLDNEGLGQWACGWIFSPHDTFDRKKLTELLQRLAPLRRLKGVLHCNDDWWMVNRVEEQTNFAHTAYRRDSRLEIICNDQPLDWLSIESSLLICLFGAD